MFDSRFKRLFEHFNVQEPEDWKSVSPSEILAVHDVGESTLNMLRLHLAARGLTLLNDQTPAFWQAHLSDAKIGAAQISESDKAVVCPFQVAIDTREQQPFIFAGMLADANQDSRPLLVQTVRTSLGNSLGDYAIHGLYGHCHIERKSLSDAHGTILGWGDRRQQFKETLSNLAGLPSSAVIVECSFGELIRSAPARGKKSAGENGKILHRQVMAWMDDYRVPWLFCDNRRLAEITAFRWLYRYWRHHQADMSESLRATRDQAELDAVL